MVFIITPAIPALATTLSYYGGLAVGTVLAGKCLHSLYQKYRPPTPDNVVVDWNDFSASSGVDADTRIEAIADPILGANEELDDFDALVTAPLATPAPFQELTGYKKVAKDIAILAPKLFFSGVGWLIGNTLLPGIGAGLGDAIGTFIGCLFSLGIEIAIMKYRNDPRIDSDDKLKDFVKSRLIQAGILSVGSLFAGWAFGPIGDAYGHLIHPNSVGGDILVALLTGLSTACAFNIAHVLMRGFFPYEQVGLNKKNIDDDLRLSGSIIWPAQTTFALSGLSSFNSYGDPLFAGAAVMIGGVVGHCLKSIMDKILEEINKRRAFTKQKEAIKKLNFAEVLRNARTTQAGKD